MRSAVLLTTLAGLAACQGDAAAPAAAPPIEARDLEGGVRFTAKLASGVCTVGAMEVRLDGDRAIGKASDVVLATLAPAGPDGRLEVTLGDAAEPLLRLFRREGHLDVLQPDGVPKFRTTIAADEVRVSDAARAPVLRVTREAQALVVADREGQALLHVTGTTDLLAAALIAGPGLPEEARDLLVCERLLAASPSKSST
jgi:hypothetical protein